MIERCILRVTVLVVLTAFVPVFCRKAAPPTTFGIISATTSSVTLSWESPPLVAGEKLKGYRLNYRAANERKEKKINLRKNENIYTVEDLAEGTVYFFSVFAKTQDGTGRGTTALEVATTSVGGGPTVPGVPQYFEVLVTGDSIFARWLPPDGDSFSGYILGIGQNSPDEEEIELDPSVQSHTFDGLETGTEYLLSLRAFNDAGISQHAFQTVFIDQQRPNPPSSFTAVPSHDSIQLSWALAEEDIRSFTVGIGIDELEEETVDINWDETNYIFDGLTPGTLYLVSVRAVNENGEGEPATDKVTTELLTTPSIPDIVSVEPTEDTITIMWTAALGVTGYEITLDPVGTETLDADATSYTFTDLTPDTDYVLRLKAQNEAGTSPPAEQIVATEQLGAPSPPVITDLQATSSSIFVEWQTSDTVILRFDLTLVNVDRQALGPHQNSHTFTNLDPNTEYTVEIRAYSQGGPSDIVSQRIYTEPVNAPLSPIIESDSATINSITITWRPPTEEIHSYSIMLGGSSPITLGPGETSYTFTGLDHGTEYFISLTATNIGGVSPAAIERLSTEEQSPLAKPNIITTDATTNTIVVQWEQTLEPILNYEISLVGTESILLGPHDTMYTFKNLQPDTRYTIELLVLNDAGPSNPARSRVTTEALPVIEPPPDKNRDGVYSVRDFYADVQGQTVILTWDAPTDHEDESLLGYLLQIDAAAISLSTSLRLHYRQQSYTFRNLEPLVEFHASLSPIRRELPVAASNVSFTTYVSRFVPPRILLAEILSSSTARIVWLDPTISPVTGIQDSRYYTLRYRPLQGSSNYLYANTREFEHSIGDLIPDTEYEFAIQTIIEGVTSGYSDVARNTTLSETDGQAPRLLTVVQLMLDYPNYIHATLNWLPPLERTNEVSGYNVQYSNIVEPSELDWQNLPVEGPVLAASVPKLTTNITASFRIQAFFFSGAPLGPFSPVISFVTPISAQRGAEENVCDPELESITQRITEIRERGGGVPPLGVPLPFCDEYLGQYACPWPTLVCTCIPRGSNVLAAVPNAKPNPGCGPVAEDPPCKRVYNRVIDAITVAHGTGIMLMGANLPYCRDDGYFENKQCGGSMCYCVDEMGAPNGLNAPLWEAGSLICR